MEYSTEKVKINKGSNYSYMHRHIFRKTTLASQKGLNQKVHMAVDSFRMPVNFTITNGTTSDCSQVTEVISDIQAEFQIADQTYNSNKVLDEIGKRRMKAVIPPEKNRKKQREYRKNLYEFSHLIENAFMKIKKWRGIAVRYARNTSSHNAHKVAVQIRCLLI